jgi:cytochrome c oxidase subunit II
MIQESRDGYRNISYFKFISVVPAHTVLAGCGGPQSALDPAGPGAAPIAQAWWIMFWGGLIVLAGMTALGLCAVYRRKPGQRRQGGEKFFLLGGGLVFPIAVLAALLFYGIRSGDALIAFPGEKETLQIELRAHQWWWEFRYPDGPGGYLYSANELRMPAGRPVDILISSGDVIHSFWLPRLGGKLDAIPGHVNVLRLQADRPGEFYGQCAEFCGAQHSRMLLYARAHDEAGFRDYLDNLRGSGETPGPSRGQTLFNEQCALCHSLNPRGQGDEPGPNLADLRQRKWLGAGTLINDRANLARWIADHQTLKPGNRMPAATLRTNEIEAVVDYLWR